MATPTVLKKYNKSYMIRVPPAIVQLINWKEGMELNIDVLPPNNLTISPAGTRKE